MKKIILTLLLISMVFLVGCKITELSTDAECTTDNDCIKAGCSGTLCITKDSPTESPYTTCEWKDEYECYKDITCGCVNGKCQFKEQEKLQKCIADKSKPQIITPEIFTASGETFDITLESNPTTGYSWEIIEIDNSVVEFIEKTYKIGENCGNPPMPGCGGQTTLTFKAKAAGETMLKLVYCHAWECDDTIGDRKTYSVLVVDEYSCPDFDRVDCMPPVSKEKTKYCVGEYHDWIKENCDIDISY